MSSIFGASTFQNRPTIKQNSRVIWVPGMFLSMGKYGIVVTPSHIPYRPQVFNQPGFSSEFLMPLFYVMIPSRCQDNIIIQFDELNEVYHHFADSGFTA